MRLDSEPCSFDEGRVRDAIANRLTATQIDTLIDIYHWRMTEHPGRRSTSVKVLMMYGLVVDVDYCRDHRYVCTGRGCFVARRCEKKRGLTHD